MNEKTEEQEKEKNQKKGNKWVLICAASLLLLGGSYIAYEKVGSNTEQGVSNKSDSNEFKPVSRTQWDEQQPLTIIYSDSSYIEANKETLKKNKSIRTNGPITLYEGEEEYVLNFKMGSKKNHIPILNGITIQKSGELSIGIEWEKSDDDTDSPEEAVMIIPKKDQYQDDDKKVLSIKSLESVEITK